MQTLPLITLYSIHCTSSIPITGHYLASIFFFFFCLQVIIKMTRESEVHPLYKAIWIAAEFHDGNFQVKSLNSSV